MGHGRVEGAHIATLRHVGRHVAQIDDDLGMVTGRQGNHSDRQPEGRRRLILVAHEIGTVLQMGCRPRSPCFSGAQFVAVARCIAETEIVWQRPVVKIQESARRGIGVDDMRLRIEHDEAAARNVQHPGQPLAPDTQLAKAVGAQDAAHARQQFHAAVGLGEKVVGAALQPGDERRLVVEHRDQHDRHFGDRGIGPQPAAHLVAVHLGHHDVEQHQVGMNLHGQDKRLSAGGGEVQIIAIGREQRLQVHAIEWIVVDDQNDRSSRHLSPLP